MQTVAAGENTRGAGHVGIIHIRSLDGGIHPDAGLFGQMVFWYQTD